MTDVLLVHNDAAGSGTERRAVERALRAAGLESSTFDPGDDWAANLADHELVVVAGGDGTVRDVLIEASAADVAVAILALGTANNIARSLDLEVGEPLRDVPSWAGRDVRPVPFDVVTVACDGEVEHAVEAAGGGFVAAALASAERTDHLADDGIVHGRSHLLDALDDSDARRWGVVVDGRDLSGDYLDLEVMNVPTLGPNFRLAPLARSDDGRFDVALVAERDRADVRAAITRRATAQTWDVVQGTVAHVVPPAGSHLHVDDGIWRIGSGTIAFSIGQRTAHVVCG